VDPAIREASGVARIRKLVENYIRWGTRLTGGCIFVSAATEFADRPGKFRDALQRQQKEWVESLGKIADSAVKTGEFGADIDTEQFAFDLYSLLLGFHCYQRMLDDEKARKRQEAAPSGSGSAAIPCRAGNGDEVRRFCSSTAGTAGRGISLRLSAPFWMRASRWRPTHRATARRVGEPAAIFSSPTRCAPFCGRVRAPACTAWWAIRQDADTDVLLFRMSYRSSGATISLIRPLSTASMKSSARASLFWATCFQAENRSASLPK